MGDNEKESAGKSQSTPYKTLAMIIARQDLAAGLEDLEVPAGHQNHLVDPVRNHPEDLEGLADPEDPAVHQQPWPYPQKQRAKHC